MQVSSPLVAIVLLLQSSLRSQAEWREISGNTNVAHFLSADDQAYRIERFDVDARTWLAPLPLPATYGPPTTFHVSGDGIFVAFGRAVKRYALDGSNEIHVGSFASNVAQILQDRGLLFINLIAFPPPHLLSLDATTFAILNTQSQSQTGTYGDSSGFSAAPGLRRLFGRSIGSSPGDIVSIPYDAAGKFGTQTDSPYHGTFVEARTAWVLPGEQRVADDTGLVYWTSNLTYSARLLGQGTLRRLAFLSNAEGVALWQDFVQPKTQVMRYSADGFPLGTLELTNTVRTLFASGTRVALFRPENSSRGIQAEVLEITDIHAPEPASLPEPRALRYTPTAFAVDRDGILLLSSPGHPVLFRWNPVTQAYLSSVHLGEAPTHLAYSAKDHAAYIAHSNGIVGRVFLNAESPAETPFASLPSVPTGLAQVGDYLFSSSYIGQQLFDSAGASGALKLNFWGVLAPLWDAKSETLFYRSFSNPTLVAERIYALTPANGHPLGSVGAEVTGPYASVDPGIPLLVSIDRKNLLSQSGRFTDPVTLALRSTGLANPIEDAFLTSNGRIQTVRNNFPYMELQEWDGLNYALKQSLTLRGKPLRLLRASGSNSVAVAQTLGGDVVFHVLDEALSLVPPPQLQPALRLEYAIESPNQFRLTWAAVQGAAGYLLQRRISGAGDWEFVARTDAAATSAADPGVKVGKVYAYRVVATNGTLTSVSAERLASSLPPPPPRNLKAQVLSPFELQLSWDPLEAISNYTVEVFTQTFSQWQILTTTPTDQAGYWWGYAQPGSVYRFRVRAANTFGDSPISEFIEITMPMAPAEVPGQGSISVINPFQLYVTWSSHAYSTGGVIERRVLPDGDWSVRATVDDSFFGIPDEPVLPSTRYAFRAYATNELGRSAYSAVLEVETPPKPIPTVPYFIFARPLSLSSLRLEWNRSEYEDGFRLQRRENEGDTNWVQVATLGPQRLSFTDSQVKPGVVYSYRVQAFNDVGDSAFSPSVNGQGADVIAVFQDTFTQNLAPFHWAEIVGGTVLTEDPMRQSGGALVFTAEQTSAITVPLDLRKGGHLIFSSQAMGTDLSLDSYVYPEFSTDGGHLWNRVIYAYKTDAESPGWVTMVVPILSQMQNRHTAFRWKFERQSWISMTAWALDNVRILAPRPESPPAPGFLVSSPNSAHSVTLFWGDAPGAMRFDIERRVGGSAWQFLQSVSALDPFFTDNAAMPGAVNAYRVRAVNPGGASVPVGPTLQHTWTALQQWSYEQYGDPDWLGAARLDVPDADGLTPRLRYAFNLDAEGPSHALIPGGTAGSPRVWLDRESGGLVVEFLRRRAGTAADIKYEVQFSSDLMLWTPTSATASVRTLDVLWETVRVQDPAASAGARARYCRVVVRPVP